MLFYKLHRLQAWTPLGSHTLKILIEFNVSADCTAFGFGIYPVRSSANPMKSRC